MARQRRLQRYPDDFRNAALARLANETKTGVAKDLDISATLLTRWKNEQENPRPRTAGKMRHFEDDVKRAAVKRVQAGESQETVAKDLHIVSSLMSSWMKKFGAAKKKNAHTLSVHSRPKPPPAPKRRNKKNYYVKVADRVGALQASNSGSNGSEGLHRRVHACVGLLKGVRGKCDNTDPVHLTALLVLATLEGKM